MKAMYTSRHGRSMTRQKLLRILLRVAVQINGKTRGVVALPVDADKETALAKAKEVVQIN